MNVISDTEDRTIVSSFIWTKHRNVTDGRTDGQTDGQNSSDYYSGRHCKQCGRAVKRVKFRTICCRASTRACWRTVRNSRFI